MIKIKKNNIGNIESSLDKKNPALTDNEDEISRVSLYFEDFYDPKKLNTFIKQCEKKFRSSDYYSSYIGNLKNDKNLHTCAVRGNITDDDANIEFHHYPFTLYDITKTIIFKYITENIKFTTFTIIKELIELHSNNMVGLVPLSVTEHQLVHDGVRVIPMKSVFGRVNDFVKEYNFYFDDDIIEKYNILIKQ